MSSRLMKAMVNPIPFGETPVAARDGDRTDRGRATEGGRGGEGGCRRDGCSAGRCRAWPARPGRGWRTRVGLAGPRVPEGQLGRARGGHGGGRGGAAGGGGGPRLGARAGAGAGARPGRGGGGLAEEAGDGATGFGLLGEQDLLPVGGVVPGLLEPRVAGAQDGG